MGKKILIVGGSERQIPIIKKCKKMGIDVINVDINKNSPGFAYSDCSEVVDILDLEENFKIAKKYNVDGVISEQSDIAVPTVAYVSEKLGVPSIGYNKSLLFTNKFMMRQFCKINRFNYPKFQLCDNLDEVMNGAKELKYPFIIKPIDNSASRGVNIIKHDKELFEKYLDTLSFSRTNQVLIEEFIDGTELTVEGFKTKSKHFSLIVSKKEHYKQAPMVAKKLFYSPNDENFDYDKLKELNNDLIECMGLPFGITHAEYKYFNGKYYLIEIAARGGGARIASDIVPFVTKIDTYKLLIEYSLGKQSEIEKFRNDLCVCVQFFDFRIGKIKEILGYEKIKKINEVIYCELNIKVGDVIEIPLNDGLRTGYFIAYETNKDALNMLCEEVESMVGIKYE